ncbi:MAG: hypothetical protein N3G20_05590 [Verrucomicrobiae bacterium]|nr:hypothetical protein [Verrucomicrobiae bacterium]
MSLLLALVGSAFAGEGARPFGIVPRRIGYWRFNSQKLENEAGHGVPDCWNVGHGQGVDGYALRIPASPGPAWVRYSATEPDGHVNLSPLQGSIRFLYRPIWPFESRSRALPVGVLRSRTRLPLELRLIEVGNRKGDDWIPRLALSIDSTGRELTLKTFDENKSAQTNFLTTIDFTLKKADTEAPELIGEWREIVINYSPTNCSLVVDGMLKQDKRTDAWSGPGVPDFSKHGTNIAFSVGSALDGTMAAHGLIDELETFDQPIGPLRNYAFAARYSASAKVSTEPPSITLHWLRSDDSPITIKRRFLGEREWTVLTTNATGMSFTDNSPAIRAGGVYEFEIGEQSLFVAVDAPPKERRGRLIILVDRTLVGALRQTVADWVSDLVGDGWEVVMHEVPRHNDQAWEQGPVNTDYIRDVGRIKALVVTEYNVAPDRTKAVILVGHVTVPLSGFTSEDGHPELRGAWPADSFYGDMDGDWKDAAVNLTSQYKQIQNVPGDGKFDVNVFDPHLVPSGPDGHGGVELAVARIDFARLPAFSPLSEIDLLKRYFAKNRRYRRGELGFKHGIAVGGFFYSLYHRESKILDANAAWLGSRLFGVGSETVFTADFFSMSENCLFGMYGGYGAYDAINNSPEANRALGINRYSTADLVSSTITPAALFCLLKGSYFGNWNLGDNCFLRALLAMPDHCLGAMFTMDTVWRFESAAVGEPLITTLTQTARGRQSVRTTFFLGDPTLRLVVTPPPRDFSARRSGRRVLLRWSDAPVVRPAYYVYRSTNGINGEFVRLTSVPLTSTEFVDTPPPAGNKVYMVRALSKVTTASGSFTNLSQGIFVTAR